MATSLRSPAKWLMDMFSNGGNDVRVDSNTMLGSPAVWYAMNTIANDVAKLPLQLLKEDADGGKEVQNKAPSHRLLTQESNEWQTADLFKEQMTAHALGWGNGRAVIRREGTRPVELLPMDPSLTDTILVKGNKYHVMLVQEDSDDPILFRRLMTDGNIDEFIQLGNRVLVFDDADVLHIPGFGYDGVKGLAVAQVLRDAIGTDLAAQRYAKNGMDKGFAGQLMLNAPPGLFRDQDDAEQFLKHFRKSHSRSEDGNSIGLLREGITANVMNMSPSDSQFLEQREFSRQDIMLIFGLQHIPGDATSSSYNSLEQKQLAYLAGCLDRWLSRWENQTDSKLRTVFEKRANVLHHVFDRKSLLRTDAETQQTVLSGLIASTIINRNEARIRIGLNPVEGGDEFLNPFTSTDEDFEEVDEELEDDEVESDLIAARLEYLINLESQRVIEMSSRKDFLDQLDGFYSKWALTLLNNNIPVDTVKALTEEHKHAILERSGTVQSVGELQSEIKELVRGWV